MRSRIAASGLVTRVALLLLPVAAHPQAYGPYDPYGPGYGSSPGSSSSATGGGSSTIDVKAQGDPFAGGLGFAPASVSARVGQKVRWTNTDQLVPHTATEAHRLWDLTGTYGTGQEGSTGFGPGEPRERAFDAGTQHYFCKVHPAQMQGVVRVPVTVKRGRLAGGRRGVKVTWSAGAPGQGLAFDVQLRRGRRWTAWKTGTASAYATARVPRRARWAFRARFRKASDAGAATDWSPPVSVRG